MKCMSAIFRERGFAAVAAILIIVMLGGLGVVVVSTSSAQQRAAAMDVLGVKAYQAARAGIEYGAYQALKTATCAASTTFSPGGNLAGFTVQVTCATGGFAYEEALSSMTVWQITATACNRAVCPAATPDSGYIERQLQTFVGTAPP